MILIRIGAAVNITDQNCSRIYGNQFYITLKGQGNTLAGDSITTKTFLLYIQIYQEPVSKYSAPSNLPNSMAESV